MVAPSISTQAKGANIERSYPDIMLDAVCVTILIAYFLRFALPALRGGFRGDEMVNMGICWHAGALKSLLANIVFWKVFYVAGVALYDLPLYLYRPGGALYYLPLYHVFGLDPLPYRIAQISILAASIPLVLRFVTTRTLPTLYSLVRSFTTCYVDSSTSRH